MKLLKPTLSPKQWEAIGTADSKFNLWCGATRSGKTFSSLFAFLSYLIALEELGIISKKAAIICRDLLAFRRNVFDQLDTLTLGDMRYIQGIMVKLWGWELFVVGCHDASAEGRLRGPAFSAVYIDEMTLIPENAWTIIAQRVTDQSAKVFATTNPEGPMHWLKKEIDANKDFKVFNFGLLDNPTLSQEERDYLMRQHKGYKYRRFILGEWCMAEGAIFPFFDQKIHVVDEPAGPIEYTICGVDVGSSGATAFILVGFCQSRSPHLIVLKEYYYDKDAEGDKKAPSEFAYDLITFVSDYGLKAMFIDPSADAFSQEIRRVAKYHPFQMKSLPIRHAKNDVINGITTIQTLLSDGELKICKCCVNLIKEMQSYRWDEKAAENGRDKPVKKYDHAVDALRYAVYSQWGHKSTIEEQTEEERKMALFEKQKQFLSPWKQNLIIRR